MSFATVGIKEREHLQTLLKAQIDVISPDTLIIAEEFGQWEDPRRRIDLLGVDKDANLVVIELKRTEDGGHIELQAIRYAAMVSAMTFEKCVEALGHYLEKQGDDDDAQQQLLDFLGWDEPDEDEFGQNVGLVFAAAEFSKELTTSVLWLNDHGLDIRCMRLRPYRHGGSIFVNVDQIVPLPEATEFQIQIREKKQRERESRTSTRDFTKYDVKVGEDIFARLAKRWAIYQIVRWLCDNGVTPAQISEAVPWRGKKGSAMFFSVEGAVDSEQFIEKALAEQRLEGRKFDRRRWFCRDEELIASDGWTYAMTNQWGHRTIEAIKNLQAAFPDKVISVSASDVFEQ